MPVGDTTLEQGSEHIVEFILHHMPYVHEAVFQMKSRKTPVSQRAASDRLVLR